MRDPDELINVITSPDSRYTDKDKIFSYLTHEWVRTIVEDGWSPTKRGYVHGNFYVEPDNYDDPGYEMEYNHLFGTPWVKEVDGYILSLSAAGANSWVLTIMRGEEILHHGESNQPYLIDAVELAYEILDGFQGKYTYEELK